MEVNREGIGRKERKISALIKNESLIALKISILNGILSIPICLSLGRALLAYV